MKLKYILFVCGIFMLVMACAQPPEAEMQSAREAVFRAENDEAAVQYGFSSLARARSALNNMQAEADAKRYDAAKTHAAEAISAAEKAIADGKSGINRVRDESAAAIAGLKNEIDETARNVNGARYSQLPLDYNALNKGIRDAYDNLEQAEVDHGFGRYHEAINKAMAIRASLSNINSTISDAIVRKKG
jgi:vacuolar-type H+-ATPase subunit D/Vma8